MTYCQRVFSRSENVPTLTALQDAFEEHDIGAEISHGNEPVDMTSTEWTDIHITYQTDRQPVRIERLVSSGDIKREYGTFLEAIAGKPDSPEKRDVTAQLEASSQVYVFTVPTEDIAEDGWRMMSTAQQFFVENTDGILQVDGEGFFYLDEDTFDILLDMEEE
jgi:hypothetical protein